MLSMPMCVRWTALQNDKLLGCKQVACDMNAPVLRFLHRLQPRTILSLGWLNAFHGYDLKTAVVLAFTNR